MNKVWAIRPGSMTNARRMVLLALADAADDEGGCFPSVDAIAYKVNLSERVARYHLDGLEADKWFARARRRRIGGSYEYYIDLHKLDVERKPERSRLTGKSGQRSPVLSGQQCPKRSGQRSPLPKEPSVGTAKKNRKTTTSRSNQHAGLCVFCGCPLREGTGILVDNKPAHPSDALCEKALAKRAKTGRTSTYDDSVDAVEADAAWRRGQK